MAEQTCVTDGDDEESGRGALDRIYIDAELLTDEAVLAVEDIDGEIRLYQERPEAEIEAGMGALWQLGDTVRVVEIGMKETRYVVDVANGRQQELEGHQITEVATGKEVEWYEVLPENGAEWTPLSLVN